MFGRSKKNKDAALEDKDGHEETHQHIEPSKAQIKRATRTRLLWALFTSFLLLISVVFLILVELGQTSKSSSIRNKIYFINLDLSEIIPDSVPDATIVNSIAETLGLHDFYRVGLWGFCEGYDAQGVTDCSTPKTLYWFNPVEILLNELLSGATSKPAPLFQVPRSL